LSTLQVPSSHGKDAAAPQFRTAYINNMMHLEDSSKSAFNDFVMG